MCPSAVYKRYAPVYSVHVIDSRIGLVYFDTTCRTKRPAGMPNDFSLILCSTRFWRVPTRVSSLEWAALGFPPENAIKVSIDAVPTGRPAPGSPSEVDKCKFPHSELKESQSMLIFKGVGGEVSGKAFLVRRDGVMLVILFVVGC